MKSIKTGLLFFIIAGIVSFSWYKIAWPIHSQTIYSNVLSSSEYAYMSNSEISSITNDKIDNDTDWNIADTLVRLLVIIFIICGALTILITLSDVVRNEKEQP